MALLLLVAATNVANLQIARAGGRRREIGTRLALGASRARLVRQLVTENLVLATAGGVLGLGLAAAGIRAAAALLPATLPRAGTLALGLPVLLLALLATGATALIAGLLPASLTVGGSLRDELQQGGRSTSGGPTRQALVAVQLALATTLVVGAALLTQSLVRLQRVDLGVGDPDHLLTTRLTRSEATEEALERNARFFDSLLREVRGLPGVAAVAVSSEVPLGDNDTSMEVAPEPRPAGAPAAGIQASWRIVTGDYFRTLQIPLRQGRPFAPEGERRSSAILSEGLARQLWPAGGDPTGRRVWLSNGQIFDVVGVAGDVRQESLAAAPTPTIYLPTTWYLWPTMTLVVRTEGDPAVLTPDVRRAVSRIDPYQPASEFRTMGGAILDSAAVPRLHAGALASFAALAVLLAVVGVAGVVGYAVARRTRELAVRLALGAPPGEVVRRVMAGALTLAGLGVLCGLGGALALGRWLSGVLFEVGAADPATFAAAAAALLAAAALAGWLPARRAAAISPGAVLREG